MIYKFWNDFTIMLINNNQWDYLIPISFIQWLFLHNPNVSFYFTLILFLSLHNYFFVSTFISNQCCFDISGPLNLCRCYKNLASLSFKHFKHFFFFHFSFWAVSLFLKMLVEELSQCNFHVFNQFLHPTLYFSFNNYRLNLYFLTIIRL